MGGSDREGLSQRDRGTVGSGPGAEVGPRPFGVRAVTQIGQPMVGCPCL